MNPNPSHPDEQPTSLLFKHLSHIAHLQSLLNEHSNSLSSNDPSSITSHLAHLQSLLDEYSNTLSPDDPSSITSHLAHLQSLLNKYSNSLSSNDPPSITSYLDHLQSLFSNAMATLRSPDDEESEARYKARSLERHSQELSDIGNAGRFISQHHAILRYIPSHNSWMIWNGQRWSPDTHGDIYTFARATIQSLRDEALALPYEQRQRSKQLFNHADLSSTPTRLHAMLDLARHDPSLLAPPQTFDSDPFLLNVLNGTINLRTGKLQPHNPLDFITHLAPVAYNPEARSPIWDQFLFEIIGQDPDIQRYLQWAVGYSLTASLQHDAIFFLYGKGGNGKTRFLNALCTVLGDYVDLSFSDLITSKQTSKVFADTLASLSHARMVIISETDTNATLNARLVKLITDGDIPSTPHKQPHNLPRAHHFKLWVATNHLPTVRDQSVAIWRRIKVIPFPASFIGREDHHLSEKLALAAPAILAWVVQGAQTWLRQGLPEPPGIKQAVADYREQQDEFADFLHDCCHFAPDQQVKAAELYKAYRLWCHLSGETNILNLRHFCHQILARGYRRERRNSGKIYLGLSLIAPLDSLPQALSSRLPLSEDHHNHAN